MAKPKSFLDFVKKYWPQHAGKCDCLDVPAEVTVTITGYSECVFRDGEIIVWGTPPCFAWPPRTDAGRMIGSYCPIYLNSAECNYIGDALVARLGEVAAAWRAVSR